jgi:DNA polymerase III epsilon subunit-like protein
MFLIFDTETTGLPRSFRAPISEVDNWPRVVQLAWEAIGVCGRRKLARSELIRPDGFTIPSEAERVHGISTELARSRGVPIAAALDAFFWPVAGASLLIAHNFSLDASVLGAEFHRLGIEDPFRRKSRLCTMLATTAYCALPSQYGYKWPKLEELHRRLFADEPGDAHDAAADVATCAKCFFELRRLGVIAAPALDRASCATCRAALSELDVTCAGRPPI